MTFPRAGPCVGTSGFSVVFVLLWAPQVDGLVSGFSLCGVVAFFLGLVFWIGMVVGFAAGWLAAVLCCARC